MFKLQQLDHVAITVRDKDRSIKWYTNVLGGKRIYDNMWDGEPAFILVGSSSIAIFSSGSGDKNQPDYNKTAIQHFAFKASKEDFINAQEDLT